MAGLRAAQRVAQPQCARHRSAQRPAGEHGARHQPVLWCLADDANPAAVGAARHRWLAAGTEGRGSGHGEPVGQQRAGARRAGCHDGAAQQLQQPAQQPGVHRRTRALAAGRRPHPGRRLGPGRAPAPRAVALHRKRCRAVHRQRRRALHGRRAPRDRLLAGRVDAVGTLVLHHRPARRTGAHAHRRARSRRRQPLRRRAAHAAPAPRVRRQGAQRLSHEPVAQPACARRGPAAAALFAQRHLPARAEQHAHRARQRRQPRVAA